MRVFVLQMHSHEIENPRLGKKILNFEIFDFGLKLNCEEVQFFRFCLAANVTEFRFQFKVGKDKTPWEENAQISHFV